MTPRAVVEASFHSALAKYKIAVAEGTWRITADNQFIDDLLKVWQRSVVTIARAEYERGRQARQKVGADA